MRITVVEIDYHAEVLRDLCLMLVEMNVEVELFAKENILRQCGLAMENYPGIQVHPIKHRSEVKHVIRNNLSTINETELVFFNTLASFYQFFNQLELVPPMVVRVHNANTYFNPNVSLRLGRSMEEIWYSVQHIFWKSILQLDWFHRRKLLKKVDRFIFPSESMIQFVMDRKLIDASRVVQVPIPLTFSKKELEKRPSTQLMITIPGIVEKKRRDYDTVLHALAKLSDEERHQIAVVLLGKVKDGYADELVAKLETLSGGITITSFKEFVPQESYEEYMQQTDLLLLPTRTATRYQIYEEKYGLTKISGGEGEMIKYSLPAVVPEDYHISKKLKPYTMYYNDALSLAQLISESVKQKATRTTPHFQGFDLSATATQLKEALEGIITSGRDRSSSRA